MKINNLTTAFDAISKLPSEPAPATGTAVGRKDQPVGDQVKLSAGAQLAQEAMAAVGRAASIRHDMVERAKAMVANGEVGSDPVRLADAIVAHVMEND